MTPTGKHMLEIRKQMRVMYNSTLDLAEVVANAKPKEGAHVKTLLLIEEAKAILRKYDGKQLREVDEYKPTLFRELFKFVEGVSGYLTPEDVVLDTTHTSNSHGGKI